MIGFFTRAKKEFYRKLNAYDEANHTEDQRIRNAQDGFLERLNREDQMDIARYHAIRKEINDEHEH